MAYAELTKGTESEKGPVFAEITGVTSKELATDPNKANIINEMGELLDKYTHTLEHQTEHDTHSNNRNSGQDR